MKKHNNYAPIVLFTYNRPHHTFKTIEALKDNLLAKDSSLIIYSDGPKNNEDLKSVNEVREIINNIIGFGNIEIIENKINSGLANSIISGINKVLNIYDRVIVVEDDLITSRYFLNYMNDALNYYEKENQIYSVSGYNYPASLLRIPTNYKNDVYFSLRPCSSGWGTWKDRWDATDWNISKNDKIFYSKKIQKEFNNGGNDLALMMYDYCDGVIDSWAIIWAYQHFRKKSYAVYPVYSFVNNVGFDESGTHTKEGGDIFFNNVEIAKYPINFVSLQLNNKIIRNFKNIFGNYYSRYYYYRNRDKQYYPYINKILNTIAILRNYISKSEKTFIKLLLS